MFLHIKGKVKTCSKTYAEMAEDLTEEIVDVRKEDKIIKSFTIEAQDDLLGEILHISSLLQLKAIRL